MTFAEIKELNNMGFSHDEILAIITGSPLAQPVPEPAPAPVPAAQAAPAPVPEPAPAPVQAAAPAAAPAAPEPAAPAQGQDLTQVMAQLANLSGNIGQLVQSIQAGNIINSRNTVPQPESVDDVMAQILNPRTNEPIGGNDK